MKPRFDIRQYKKSLRKHYKIKRDKLPAHVKEKKDKSIRFRLTGLKEYKDAKLVLIYMSSNSEIDTKSIIETIWEDGKKAALPRCISGTREMDFYEINSFGDLEEGSFSLMEPKLTCRKITQFKDSICVLPGFCFDDYGYRLGYGGGYYDRFLSQKYEKDGGSKIGICYDFGLRLHLSHGKYDIPCDIIVTESKAKKTKTAKPAKK